LTDLLTAAALYFSTSCERYLVAPDPTALEQVPDEDLTQAALVTKARLYLYDHPLDRVVLRLLEQEQETRAIIDGAP
jgi:hypothetical protein